MPDLPLINRIAEWLLDPALREAFATGFFLGLCTSLLGRGIPCLIRQAANWYEKRRQEKKQEREKPKPALGLLWTRDLQPLCPACKTPLPEFRTSRDDKGMCCVCPGCHQFLRLPARFASFAEARAEAARELHRK